MSDAAGARISGQFIDREARAIFDAITDGFIVLDSEWRILYVNPAAARLTQKPAGALAGRTYWEEWPESAGSDLERQYRRALLEQRAVHFEHCHAARGRDAWLDIHAYPFGSGLAVYFRDITERKRASELARSLEEQLRRKVEEFETLFGSMPTGMSVSEDPGCRVIRVNDALAEILGIPIGQNTSKSGPEAAGLRYRLFSAGREVPAEDLPHQRAQREGRASPRMELEVVRDDGVRRSIYGSAVPLFDSAGAVRGSIGAFADITERKAAEEALRASEERYRSLVSASAFVWTTDANGDFSWEQPSWEAYTGQPWEEYKGNGWIKAVHPEDRERVADAWDAAVRTKSMYEVEWRAWHAGSRQWRHCWTRSVPVLQPDGEVREWIGAVTDVHERKLLEAKLQHDDKLDSLGVLAGGVAHDFNNLLVGILGNASLALDEAGPRLRPLLQEIVKASERAADLTRQMLAYAGKGQFAFELLDLSREVREVVSLVRSTLTPRAYLTLDLDYNLPAIRADRGQVQQIIMNLVINAGEALGERRGSIRVATSLDAPPGRRIVLTVQDDGAGMSSEVKARIFDPFFTTKFTGRGLGLAAVMGIVRAHNGTIEVDSLPGRGTTFRVYFPAVAEVEPRPDGSEKTAGGAAPLTVLVIDDEEIVLAVARRTLVKAGAHVLAAATGRDAIRVFRERAGEIDVVILDASVPDLGGRDVLRALRQVRPGIPVLVSSGHPATEVARYFGEDAPSGLLSKPYKPAALVDAVAAYGKRRHKPSSTAWHDGAVST